MKKFFILLLTLVAFTVIPIHILARDCDGNPPTDMNELNDYISSCQTKIKQSQAEQKTLSSAIGYLDSQINLASAEINKTSAELATLEAEIIDLSGKIESIDYSLDDLTKLFISRVQSDYKERNANDVILSIFNNSGFFDFFRHYQYIQKIRDHDREVLITLESARLDFDQQKSLKEVKQDEAKTLQFKLKSQQDSLSAQKSSKNRLLADTKNSEQKYQSLLSQARAELEAIQNILAGKGNEIKVGNVSEGEKIATIIQGSSCNSSGSHLHFMVSQNGITQNPFNFLQSISHRNCSGSSCNSGDGDPFNPSGSWTWPIDPEITFSQGYGSTWAVNNTWVGSIYSFHNGIDINSSSSEIRAVKSGILYRGSYSGYNGCVLRYVRVDHDNSDLDTFYLHINYI